ncbi:MAG: tRNA (adenosine(37)-N6)-threonylcarbamoyltransferase complex ATPase subunit type 1 TsaE [Cyanobacteria bacterium J06623_7]
MPKILLPTLEDTLNFGYLLGQQLIPGTTLLLCGNLGVGKTSLVQGIGRGLNIEELIVSPTFTLINEYLDGRIPLYHLDLYRLEASQIHSIYPELYWLGEEVEPGITAIEWSERLTFLPPCYLKIELSNLPVGRQAVLEPHGKIQDLKFIESFSHSARQ